MPRLVHFCNSEAAEIRDAPFVSLTSAVSELLIRPSCIFSATTVGDLQDPQTLVIPIAQGCNIPSKLPAAGGRPGLQIPHDCKVAVLPRDLNVRICADDTDVGDSSVAELLRVVSLTWIRHAHVDSGDFPDASQVAPSVPGKERPFTVGGAVWIDPRPDVHDVNDMLPRDEVGGPLHIDHHDLGGP